MKFDEAFDIACRRAVQRQCLSKSKQEEAELLSSSCCFLLPRGQPISGTAAERKMLSQLPQPEATSCMPYPIHSVNG